VLELSGGSPAMARAIFAGGHMLPAFALLITAAGAVLLLDEHPRRIAYWPGAGRADRARVTRAAPPAGRRSGRTGAPAVAVTPRGEPGGGAA
jgi:hypothetical protein